MKFNSQWNFINQTNGGDKLGKLSSLQTKDQCPWGKDAIKNT